MQNLKKNDNVRDKSGVNMDGLFLGNKEGEWNMQAEMKNREIPCESFMGKSGCESNYDKKPYQGYSLRKCRWNQNSTPQSCETLKGDKEKRLQVTLGLSDREFREKDELPENNLFGDDGFNPTKNFNFEF